MKFVLDKPVRGTGYTIIVSEPKANRSIAFNATALGYGISNRRNIPEDSVDLFYEINGYLSTLDHHVRYELFKIYDEIREIFDDTFVSFSARQEEITMMVNKIYELISLQGLSEYISPMKHITYPSNMISRHDDRANDPAINASINYFYEDYKGLVVLTIALRFMLPIWGEYLNISKAATGNNYKEYAAFRLLVGSNLIDSEPMNRLKEYVTEWRTKGTKKSELEEQAGVLDGISSHAISDYLLAGIVVRKLAALPVQFSSDNASLISNVYSYLNQMISGASKRFRTYGKNNDGGSDDGETEKSIFEKYKISTKITHGDIAFMVSYCKDPIKLARDIDKSIDEATVLACYHHNLSIPIEMENHTLLLVQWVLSKVMPTAVVYELGYQEITVVVSVVQSLLIHWGFYELAVIITGKRNLSNMNGFSTTITIDPILLEKLDYYYPYFKPTTRGRVKPNVAHTAILDYAEKITINSIDVNIPGMLAEKSGITGNSHICNTSIINTLASLLIHLNQ